jgi:hypothetical protein
MNEREGRAVLRARFEAAGLHIVEDHRLEVDGHVVVADGFDAARGIGYEYLTREAGDHEELAAPVVAALEAHAEAGDLVLFLIDEVDVGGPDELGALADRFLETLRARGRLS